jgi:hypothetical protein
MSVFQQTVLAAETHLAIIIIIIIIIIIMAYEIVFVDSRLALCDGL